MKWVIIGLAAVAAIFFGFGYYVEHAGRSADESLGEVVPWLIGSAILIFDAALLVVFVIYKAFTT